MSDLISRNAAIEAIDKNRQDLLSLGMDGAEHTLVHYGRRVIEEQPTIDAVEVVRCKDCKHSEEALLPDKELWCKVKDTFCTSDWFCADGKRRDDESIV